jgi:hypothetical protein
MKYPKKIRIQTRGGATMETKFFDWLTVDKGAGRSMIRLNMGGMSGIGTFSLSHGWGVKPLGDWRIHPDDLAELRVWAETEQGRRIAVTPRSTGPRVKPKKGKKAHPRQTSLFDA